MASAGTVARGASSSSAAEAGPRRIVRLDPSVVNRIAAGEVIHRPANALKEMIENSIDAGSTFITISAQAGGVKLLQVQDNGKGIQREDFPILCERFTTSKLRKFEDLRSMQTYGFRGEALSSISMVAHVTITSKTKDSSMAYKAKFSDGKMLEPPQPIAGLQGTQIIVEDLFYNTPTRLRAMRREGKEYRDILDVVTRYAIHCGDKGVGFTCKKHGKSTADIITQSASTVKKNIAKAFGKKIADELVEVEATEGQWDGAGASSAGRAESGESIRYKLKGFVTNANWSQKKGVFILFINDRLVESSRLRRAIFSIYAEYLPKGSQPFIYLSLSLPPEDIDVNVHPTKKEVMFLNQERILEQTAGTIRAKLVGANRSRTFHVQSILSLRNENANIGTSSSKLAVAASAAPREKLSASSTTVKTPVLALDSFHHSNVASRPRIEPMTSSSSNSSSSSSSSSQESVSVPEPQVIKKKSKAPEVHPSRLNRTMRLVNQAGSMEAYLSSASKKARKKMAPSASSREVKKRRRLGPRSIDPLGASSGESGDDNDVLNAPSDAEGSSEPERSGIEVGSEDSRDEVPPAARRSYPKPSKRPPGSEDPQLLTSVSNLKDAIKFQCHSSLRKMLKKHVFVGVVNAERSVLQLDTKLFLLNHLKLVEELMYQQAVMNLGHFYVLRLPRPQSVQELLDIAFTRRDNGLTKAESEEKVSGLCGSSPFLANERTRAMLKDFFEIDIDGNGNLLALPDLLPGYLPQADCLILLVEALACDDIGWGDEEECLQGVAMALAKAFCALPTPDSSDSADYEQLRKVLQHVILPCVRNVFLPPADFLKDGTVQEVAELKNLYRLFERPTG